MAAPTSNYDPLAMYQFCTVVNSENETGRIHDEFLCGQVSWCGNYLRISSFQETQPDVGLNGLVLKFVSRQEADKQPIQFNIKNSDYECRSDRIRKRIATEVFGSTFAKRLKPLAGPR